VRLQGFEYHYFFTRECPLSSVQDVASRHLMAARFICPPLLPTHPALMVFAGKFQMVRLARALVVAPGGVGTLDELFESLTLLQTKKIKVQKMPIVLLGKKYWQSVINMQAMVDAGTIAASDVGRLFYTDDVQEAFDYVTSRLLEVEQEERESRIEAIAQAGTTPVVEANASR